MRFGKSKLNNGNLYPRYKFSASGVATFLNRNSGNMVNGIFAPRTNAHIIISENNNQYSFSR